MANIGHWNLTQQYGFKITKKLYDHQTETVLEFQKAKILWDMSVQTDHAIQLRRPVMVVKDKELDHMWLIDIAVTENSRLKDKKNRRKWKSIKI